MVSAGTALARLNANGTPDASFGANGTVQTTNPSVVGFPYAIAMQADGKIVISGSGVGGGGTNFFTSRYTSTALSTRPLEERALFTHQPAPSGARGPWRFRRTVK
jgi:hypothetical protein